MKLPRNLSGAQLIKALEKLGYQTTQQTGSHVRLTCFPLPNPLSETTSHSTRLQTTAAKSLVTPQAGEGANESLRVGTLAAILADVAAHHGITRDALLTKLFE